MAVIQTGIGGRGLTSSPLPPVTIGSNRRKVCGIGRLGATQANCPSGQWNSNLNVCCAAPGTPAVQDPCSIFNQPAYLATQSAAQESALSGQSGTLDQSILESVSQYDQNVQSDAINCVSNPGLQFTDNTGQVVVCPAPYTMDNGIPVSIYTAAQIAAMIAGTATPAITAADNAPDNTLDAAAPTTKTVNPLNPVNVLSNSAAQTGSGTPVTQQSIANTQNVTGNASNTTVNGTTNTSSDVTIGGVDVTSWIEQNWVLLAAGAAALFILPGLMKGR